jgi:hypothetical protein
MTLTGVLICLLNLVLWAAAFLFAILILTFVFSLFIPGLPIIYPGAPQPQGGSRVVQLLYVAIGLVLLINFIMCCTGAPLLPILLGGGRGMR